MPSQSFYIKTSKDHRYVNYADHLLINIRIGKLSSLFCLGVTVILTRVKTPIIITTRMAKSNIKTFKFVFMWENSCQHNYSCWHRNYNLWSIFDEEGKITVGPINTTFLW